MERHPIDVQPSETLGQDDEGWDDLEDIQDDRWDIVDDRYFELVD